MGLGPPGGIHLAELEGPQRIRHPQRPRPQLTKPHRRAGVRLGVPRLKCFRQASRRPKGTSRGQPAQAICSPRQGQRAGFEGACVSLGQWHRVSSSRSPPVCLRRRRCHFPLFRLRAGSSSSTVLTREAGASSRPPGGTAVSSQTEQVTGSSRRGEAPGRAHPAGSGSREGFACCRCAQWTALGGAASLRSGQHAILTDTVSDCLLIFLCDLAPKPSKCV